MTFVEGKNLLPSQIIVKKTEKAYSIFKDEIDGTISPIKDHESTANQIKVSNPLTLQTDEKECIVMTCESPRFNQNQILTSGPNTLAQTQNKDSELIKEVINMPVRSRQSIDQTTKTVTNQKRSANSKDS